MIDSAELLHIGYSVWPTATQPLHVVNLKTSTPLALPLVLGVTQCDDLLLFIEQAILPTASVQLDIGRKTSENL